jgi:hypothetical protein
LKTSKVHRLSAASLRATKVTLALADDGTLRMNRYPAIGASEAPTVATWIDDPASSVNAVGVDETGDG